MGGRVLQRRVYDLDLPDYPDLTVQVYGITMGEVLELSQHIEAKIFGALVAPQDRPHLEYVVGLLGRSLAGWDLAYDAGRPIPADADGVGALDPPLFRAITLAWLDAVSGVPAPLDRPSASGGPSPEASLPMEVS